MSEQHAVPGGIDATDGVPLARDGESPDATRDHTRDGGLVARLREVASVFWREVAKFGVIGAGAFTIDLVLFNVLFYGPLHGHLATSRVLSGVASTSFAWVGNRMWTFRHRRNRPAHHEALLFFGVNAVGLLISTGYLSATHDLMHWTSRLEVNVNNIIGIGIATLMRFWAYRRFVFAAEDLGGEHSGGR